MQTSVLYVLIGWKYVNFTLTHYSLKVISMCKIKFYQNMYIENTAPQFITCPLQ